MTVSTVPAGVTVVDFWLTMQFGSFLHSGTAFAASSHNRLWNKLFAISCTAALFIVTLETPLVVAACDAFVPLVVVPPVPLGDEAKVVA